jgi:nucleoid-associated protein YgaU
MSATSIGRIVVPYLALVAACGAALAFGITHVRREPPVETGPATAASTISQSASFARDEGAAALITAQAEANAGAITLALSPRSPEADESVPVFDIARIERTGDAVIAGRAAPGAIVELLRGGEPYDRAVADDSGQFVMVPPRLPRGDSDLTLRSRQPGGKQAISKQSVVVALGDVEPSFGADRARAEETLAANRSAHDHAAGQRDIAISELPRATAARLSGGGSPSAVVVPKTASTIVSRGDSLWRISHAAYGAGLRYAVIYKANRDQIRNPNRIFPGQIFVLPPRER